MREEQIALGLPKVLVVDDVPLNLKFIRESIENENYNIFAATNGGMALKSVERNIPDLILLDIMMPDIDGYEVCRRLKSDPATAEIPVIFITARDTKEDLIKGFSVGGVDYITKPFDKEEVRIRVKTHLEKAQLTKVLQAQKDELERRNRELEAEIVRRQQAEAERDESNEAKENLNNRLSFISKREAQEWGIDSFIGKSRMVQNILADVRRLQGVGTTGVLITGESGTGKELIARAIHFGSDRTRDAFIAVNCSAIPSELAESQFFGHTQGAFTGASQSSKGYFELADGGTLFLDEIGEMPFNLQTKLLRTLEDGYIRQIGASKEKQVYVRVISATNADMQAKIAEGTFREDLYFRLAGYVITVPPLRARKEDIPLLVEHFLDVLGKQMGRSHTRLSPQTAETLKGYSFPGNVRELKYILEGGLLRCDGDFIEPKHLHLIARKAGPSPTEFNEVHSAPNDEDLILSYVRVHGSISNTECRQLLSVNINRAKYRLQKLMSANKLVRQGASSAVRYYLP